MTNENNQIGKKMKTAKQLAKKQERQLAIRLEEEFAITGLYVTRSHLENLGYDTTNVDDSMMQELASKIGDIIGWDGEGAEDAAEELEIPQHGEKPAA